MINIFIHVSQNPFILDPPPTPTPIYLTTRLIISYVLSHIIHLHRCISFGIPLSSVFNSRDFAEWMTLFDITMDASDNDSNIVKIWFSKVHMIDLKIVNRLDISNVYSVRVCVCDQQIKTMFHKHFPCAKWPSLLLQKKICCILFLAFITYYFFTDKTDLYLLVYIILKLLACKQIKAIGPVSPGSK